MAFSPSISPSISPSQSPSPEPPLSLSVIENISVSEEFSSRIVTYGRGSIMDGVIWAHLGTIE